MTLRTAHITLNSEVAKVRYEVATLLILVSAEQFDFSVFSDIYLGWPKGVHSPIYEMLTSLYFWTACIQSIAIVSLVYIVRYKSSNFYRCSS